MLPSVTHSSKNGRAAVAVKKTVRFFVDLVPAPSTESAMELGKQRHTFASRPISRPLQWKWRRRNCMLFALVMVSCAAIGLLVRNVMGNRYDSRVFHSSAHVPVHDRLAEITPERNLMLAAMHNDNTLCGIAAANFLSYKAFVMLRLNRGGCNGENCEVEIIEAFNIGFTAPKYMLNGRPTKQKNHEDHSLMCLEDAPWIRHRWLEIDATYEDASGKLHAVKLTGKPAMCFQHFWDVLNGIWPCPATKDVMRVPVFYDLIN